ncbi:MAG: HEAT repeat domain-containing protein [Planctomycetes bacterium]|nr:HEAT repeat domain-containing protein [Planctomycetota bacterium]MCB9919428.1 HEAT repeat domain-containing protein [Planctomycetota bacterium]
MSTPRHGFKFGWILLFASCSSVPWDDRLPLVQEIQTLETLRPAGAEGRLASILRDAPTWFRARAARALGRLGTGAVTTPLCAALGDPDESVREEVAFALGQLAYPETRVQALGALLPMLRSQSATFRMRLVEAIGKLGAREHVPQILPLLADADPGVRGAAALALHRVRQHDSLVPNLETDTSRVATDATILEGLVRAHGTETDPRARWQIVYSMIGLHAPATTGPFLASVTSNELWERFFATRGLAELARQGQIEAERDDECCDALLRRLDDLDRRVVIEAALALGDPSPSGRNSAARDTPPPFDHRRVLDALAAKTTSDDPGIVVACVQGIGHFQTIETKANSTLNFAIASTKVRIRAAAIEADARLLGDGFSGILQVYAKEEDWRIRAAVARATRFLSNDHAGPILERLAQDAETRVRLAVLEAVANRESDPKAVSMTVTLLEENDAAIREEAATTLERLGSKKAIAPLREALVTSRDPEFADARVAIIRAIGALSTEDATAGDFIEASLADPVNRVRRAAWSALADRRPVRPLAAMQLADEGRKVALPGRDYPAAFLTSRPRVQLETTKGILTLEFDPAAAPNHVYNLLHFIRKGAYDGRVFHRVVPNFVVQGGDMRGDGYGNSTWWGGRLRREVSPLEFDAYFIGMPRGQDIDSGGDQIFITLVPTPHLDGAYTCFGRVIDGFDVLQSIEIGDRIERAREL